MARERFVGSGGVGHPVFRVGRILFAVAVALAGGHAVAANAIAAERGSDSPAFKGLPPAPKWRDGAIKRGRDGGIRLDTRDVDALRALKKGRRMTSLGTGFFVTPQGQVATNRHVIDDCALIIVEDTGGRSAQANLLAVHDHIDLAVLKTGLNPGRWAVIDTLGPRQRGEPLTVIGYPTRTLPPVDPKVATVHFRERIRDRRFYLFDGNVYSGNSGGPAINERGHVIGVVTATLNKPEIYKRTGKLIDGGGLAVSAEATYRFLRDNGIQPTSRAAADRRLANAPRTTSPARAMVVKITCWQ